MYLYVSKQLVAVSMEHSDLEDQFESLKHSNDTYCEQLDELKAKLKESEKLRKQLDMKDRASVDQVDRCLLIKSFLSFVSVISVLLTSLLFPFLSTLIRLLFRRQSVVIDGYKRMVASYENEIHMLRQKLTQQSSLSPKVTVMTADRANVDRRARKSLSPLSPSRVNSQQPEKVKGSHRFDDENYFHVSGVKSSSMVTGDISPLGVLVGNKYDNTSNGYSDSDNVVQQDNDCDTSLSSMLNL